MSFSISEFNGWIFLISVSISFQFGVNIAISSDLFLAPFETFLPNQNNVLKCTSNSDKSFNYITWWKNGNQISSNDPNTTIQIINAFYGEDRGDITSQLTIFLTVEDHNSMVVCKSFLSDGLTLDKQANITLQVNENFLKPIEISVNDVLISTNENGAMIENIVVEENFKLICSLNCDIFYGREVDLIWKQISGDNELTVASKTSLHGNNLSLVYSTHIGKEANVQTFICSANYTSIIYKVTLTIFAIVPPNLIITSQKILQSGKSDTFTCSSLSFPVSNISWEVCPESIENDTIIKWFPEKLITNGSQRLFNATSSFTFTPKAAAHKKNISCFASNPTFTQKTEVTMYVQASTVDTMKKEYENVSFFCPVHENNSIETFSKVLKNGTIDKNICPTSYFEPNKFICEYDIGNFTVVNITEEDTALYLCENDYSLGGMTLQFYSDILVFENETKLTENITVFTQSESQIQCELRSSHNWTLNWLIPLVTSQIDYTSDQKENGIWSIKSTLKHNFTFSMHENVITCLVESEPHIKTQLQLDVKGQPEITMNNSNLSFIISDNATFILDWCANPQIFYLSWEKNTSEIYVNKSDSKYFSEKKQTSSICNHTVFIINDLTINDSGIYRFFIENELGNADAYFNITVFLPSPSQFHNDKNTIIIIVTATSVGLLIIIIAAIIIKLRCTPRKTLRRQYSDKANVLPFSSDVELTPKLDRPNFTELDEDSYEARDDPTLEIQILELLKKTGSSGHMYSAFAWTKSTKDEPFNVSVKLVTVEEQDEAKIKLRHEIDIFKKLKPHPNVISYIGTYFYQGDLGLVMESLPNGILKQHLLDFQESGVKNNINSKELFLRMAYEVASGMYHLANQQILHRNLATRNVYLVDGMKCKIGNFSHACDMKRIEVIKCNPTENKLPVRWLALETLVKNEFILKSDIWSFGVLLWEIMNLGATPYKKYETAREIREALQDGYRLDVPPYCSLEVHRLMLRCWKENPNNRPSFGDIKTILKRSITTQGDLKLKLDNLSGDDQRVIFV